MKFCTHRAGNPGNVLLTRRNPPKYLYQCILQGLTGIYITHLGMKVFVKSHLIYLIQMRLYAYFELIVNYTANVYRVIKGFFCNI